MSIYGIDEERILSMSKENFNKFAKISEKFAMKIYANYVANSSHFFSSDIFTVRTANKIEDTNYKTDFFLMKNGLEHDAFDVKCPCGVNSVTYPISWGTWWIEPFNSQKKEKDISTLIKTIFPSIKNRYLTYIGKDAIYFVTAENLSKWALANRSPDYRLWKDNPDAFSGFTWKDALRNFYWDQNKGKILTKITVEELEAIGSKIRLMPNEHAEIEADIIRAAKEGA